MIRLAWKQILYSGFILFVIFSGCTKKEATIEELILQAEDLQNVGQFDGAIVLLEKGLEREPNRVDLLEELAFAYSANKDPMLAAMSFMRIAELVPDQPEYLIYAANSMTEAGDTVGAVGVYEQYLAINSTDRAVWLILAGMQKQKGNLGGALEAFLAAEKVQESASQEIAIAELYLQAKNLVQAQSWFARALEGDSEYRDDSLLGLLETAIRSERFAEADALLKQLDAEYPGIVDQSAMQPVRAQLAEWSRRRQVAIEAMAAIEARNAQELQEAIESAQAELPEEEPVEEPPQQEEPVEETPVAIEAPVELVEEVPVTVVDATSHLALARQRRDEGKTDEAIGHYKTALIENDNQPSIWGELSELYLESGNNRWAQATASEAVRRDPENPGFVLLHLRAANQTMDLNRFIREMEDAFKKFPENPEILLFIGKASADQGNERNARILFQKFLEFAPLNHPERSTVEMELADLGN